MSGRCWKKVLLAGKIVALPFFDRGKKKLYGLPGSRFGDRNCFGRKIRHARAGHELRRNSVWRNLGWFSFRESRLICTETGSVAAKGFTTGCCEKSSGLKGGIAYDEQIVEKIPVEPHDAKVDFILTPSRCVGPPDKLRGSRCWFIMGIPLSQP